MFIFMHTNDHIMNITHDIDCEQSPGGDYFGRIVANSNPPMAIPCHCPARADGATRARREIRREAKGV